MTKASTLQMMVSFWLFESAIGALVITFSEDGYYSDGMYMSYKDTLIKDKEEISICLWINVNFLRGHKTTAFSAGNANTFSSLFIGIIYDEECENKTISMCYEKWFSAVCLNQPFDHFQGWHHYCFYINLIEGLDGEINALTKSYFDGNLFSEETINNVYPELTNLNRNESLKLSIGGNYDPSKGSSYLGWAESFSGKIGDVYLSFREIESSEVEDMALCRSGIPNDSFISLEEDKWETREVKILKVGFDFFCEDKRSDVIVFNHRISYTNIKLLCDSVRGELPTFTSEEKMVALYYRINQTIFDNVLEVNPECRTEGWGRTQFWISQTRQQLSNGSFMNLWKNPYTGKVDNLTFRHTRLYGSQTQPNIFFYGPKEIFGAFRNKPEACGVCLNVKSNYKKLVLKGMCENEFMDKYFDREYYIDGMKNGKVYFKGIENSHIYFDKYKHWRLESLRMPAKHVMLSREDSSDGFPIGRNSWIFPAKNFKNESLIICKTGVSNPTIVLTLSNCYPKKFTCDSGDCIPLAKKCDTIVTCEDQSDEQNCTYLKFHSIYASAISPRTDDGRSPLPIFFHVDIFAFTEIETVELRITIDFYLSLRWYDSRLDFLDLNEIASLNSLSEGEVDKLWTPKIAFTNALGPFQTVVDKLCVCTLIREDQPRTEDITQNREALLFYGEVNSVNLVREYYQDYSCDFDLTFYPFDTQLCKMEFTVQGWTSNYVVLMLNGTGVSYRGKRHLVEYSIQMEKAFTGVTTEGRSTVQVRVVFRRRMEYHVTNTLFQTLVLVLVGCSTLFFNVLNFQDRIMVTLTVMLVVATLTSTIQAGLPKTAYYKLIDYWLMFCFNILVVLMFFHTYLNYYIRQERLRSASRNIVRPVAAAIGAASRKPLRRPGKFFPVDDVEEDVVKAAIRVNKKGKVGFAGGIALFNLIFWSIAFSEYVKNAENYILKDSF